MIPVLSHIVMQVRSYVSDVTWFLVQVETLAIFNSVHCVTVFWIACRGQSTLLSVRACAGFTRPMRQVGLISFPLWDLLHAVGLMVGWTTCCGYSAAVCVSCMFISMLNTEYFLLLFNQHVWPYLKCVCTTIHEFAMLTATVCLITQNLKSDMIYPMTFLLFFLSDFCGWSGTDVSTKR